MRAPEEQAIYDGAAKLGRALSLHAALRAGMKGKLHLPAGERDLTSEIEYYLDLISARLKSMATVFDDEIGQMQDAEFERESQAIRAGVDQLVAPRTTIPQRPTVTPARAANDDELLELVTALRAGARR